MHEKFRSKWINFTADKNKFLELSTQPDPRVDPTSGLWTFWSREPCKSGGHDLSIMDCVVVLISLCFSAGTNPAITTVWSFRYERTNASRAKKQDDNFYCLSGNGVIGFNVLVRGVSWPISLSSVPCNIESQTIMLGLLAPSSLAHIA